MSESNSERLAQQLLDTLDLLKEYRDHTFSWAPGEEMAYAQRIREIWQPDHD